MGLDAYFAIKFKEVPTESQLKQLRFHLIHRFPKVVYWKHWDETKELQPVLVKIRDHMASERMACDPRFYDIDSMVRYYGHGYERGPGLEIAAMLLYLIRRGDIEEVHYGGDSYGQDPWTEEDAIDLMNHYIEHGRLPFGMYPNEYYNYDQDDVPICDWCDMPMADVGGGRGETFWRCYGCQKRLELPSPKTKEEVLGRWTPKR